uniref:Uncharacterized protein n=1 Tax=Anguilla anguilla TaxID=7936 RepID=A0A0E9REY1_ANGAN
MHTDCTKEKSSWHWLPNPRVLLEGKVTENQCKVILSIHPCKHPLL